MADDKTGAAAPTPAAEPAPTQQEEVTSTPDKLKKGKLKHIATKTYHEVDDIEGTLRAYPDQFEKVDAIPSNGKTGWGGTKTD